MTQFQNYIINGNDIIENRKVSTSLTSNDQIIFIALVDDLIR